MGGIAAARGGDGPDDDVRRMLAAVAHRGALRGEVLRVGDVAIGVSGSDGFEDATLEVRDGLAVAYVGTFDGGDELRNRAGLAATAEPAGAVWRLIREGGIEAVNALRGPFTVVATDGVKIWAARDHLGYRAAFHRQAGARAWVANDAHMVLAGAGLPAAADLEVVEATLLWGALVEDLGRTGLVGVRRVERSHAIEIGERTTRILRYWFPERLLETAHLTDDELQAAFDEAMSQACRRALTGSDVVSLSGGVDSPAVAAYAAPTYLERTGRPLPALSAVYPRQPSADESAFITLAAERIGMELHTFEEDHGGLDGIDEWMAKIPAPLTGYFLAEASAYLRRVRAMGWRSALTGEVVEWIAQERQGLLPWLLARGRFGALARYYPVLRASGRTRASIARQLGQAFVPVGVERWVEGRRAPSAYYPPWVDAAWVRAREPRGDPVPARRRWGGYQTVLVGGPGTGEEAEDVVQSVTGARFRKPFADIDVYELFVSLPAEQKFPGPRSKALLRKLVRGKVPDEILDRPRKTFFDEAIAARADYPSLRRLLVDPPVRFRGVDYAALAARLEAEDLPINEYFWTQRMAVAHAFAAR